MGKTDDEIYDSDSAGKNYTKRTKYTRLRSLNGQTVTRSQTRIPQASNSENHTAATHASRIQEMPVDFKKSKNISTGKSKVNYAENDGFPNEKHESTDENVSCCSAIFINQKQGKQSVLYLRNVDNTENVVTSVPISSKPRQTIKILNIKGEKYTELKHQEHIVTNSRNIFYYLDHTTKGQQCSLTMRQATKNPIIRNVSELKPYKVASRFDRRVTALVWHPTNPTVLAVASKGGQIMLWNYEKFDDDDMFIPGVGPGGAICAMKFHEENPTMLYTASVLGRVMIQDFCGKKNSILLDTLCSDNWFASLDVSHQMKLLMAGDCKGYAYLTNLDGENIWGKKKRLHKCKVTHIEFCPKQPSLMATGSVDHTVKLWDLRMLSDNSTTPLHCFIHEKGVNSAYFSLTNGASLLTTDQFNELRVYTGPLWNSETTILHPHRHFQHLTPIKAYWHPLEDIVFIGRYPHDDFAKDDKRTVDFYDGHTGNILHRLWSPDVTSIVSLSRFNHTGDALATGMGFNTIIWKSETEYDIYIKSMVQNVIKQLRSSSRSTPSRRERRERGNNQDRKEKKRLKQLIKTKT